MDILINKSMTTVGVCWTPRTPFTLYNRLAEIVKYQQIINYSTDQ